MGDSELPIKTDQDGKGRFVAGNKAAKGSHMSHVAMLRETLHKSQSPAEVLAVAAVVRKRAIKGDMEAARLYFDRILGKSLQPVDITSGGEAIWGGVVVMPAEDPPRA